MFILFFVNKSFHTKKEAIGFHKNDDKAVIFDL